MHEVIQRRGGCEVAELQASAREQGEDSYTSWMPERPTRQGRVPCEDIIGSFEARSGTVDLESYSPNSEHAIFSTRGLFQLDSNLHHLLFEELQQFISMFSKVSAKVPDFQTISLPMVVARIHPSGQPAHEHHGRCGDRYV